MIRARDSRKSLFKYTDVATATKILENKTVRYSSPLLFNDPFDVQSGLHLPFDVESLSTKVMDRIEELATTPDLTAPPSWSEILPAIRAETASRGFQRAKLQALIAPGLVTMEVLAAKYEKEIQGDRSEYLPRMRVLCLSETRDNLLMWSHYAQGHQGVVFELAVMPSIDNELCAARPVIYQASPPPLFSESKWMGLIFAGSELGADELFRDYPFIKSEKSRYEREWRVSYVHPDPQNDLFSDHPLRFNEVTAVYFGSRMLTESRTTIRSLLTDHFPEARLYQAREAGAAFELTFDAC